MNTHKPRVIPVLLLKDKGLIKTKKFNKPVYIGNPTNAIRVFNEKYVQEIALLDIEVSKKNNSPDFSSLELIGTEAFFPLAYGGGIKTKEDAIRVIKLGFEKVVVNAECIQRKEIISEISAITGSQGVVVCVNILKTLTGSYQLYNHISEKRSKINLVEYIRDIESRGAGELIIQSVDRDGMMNGYDVRLINMVASATSIPVIALGGAKDISDFVAAVKAGASAVAAGSMFVFHGPHKAVLISYPSRDELKREFYQKI